MASHTGDRNKRIPRIWAGVGLLLTAAWLSSSLAPAAREMMLDTALAFLLGLAVTGLLWRAGAQSASQRPFWKLLALGWTVSLVGNVAWGLYEVLTGRKLPYLSLVDLFYVARYGLVLAAFWRILAPWTGRRWAGLVEIVLVAGVVAWLTLFRPVLASTEATLAYFVAGALFPFLDAVIVPLALWSWWGAGAGRFRNALGLLLLAMIAYGAANWVTFGVRMADFEASSPLAAFLWTLSDVVTGVAALHVLWPGPAAAK